jgi:predicted enzyme related to lactoylglutathione lyase
MANLIMHFEIPADDVERAKAFYENTFGWKIVQFPMPPGQEYYGVTARHEDGTGINGGLMQRKMAGQPFMNYITVESIDDMGELIQANGGVIVLPKQDIGGMGWISAFTDPENNLIGLHEVAPGASQAPSKTAAKPAARKAAPKKAAKKAVKKAAAKRTAPRKTAKKKAAKRRR